MAEGTGKIIKIYDECRLRSSDETTIKCAVIESTSPANLTMHVIEANYYEGMLEDDNVSFTYTEGVDGLYECTNVQKIA